MIGFREGRELRFPEPTHSNPDELDEDLFGQREPHRTAWDAIGDLSEPTPDTPSLKVGGKWGDLLPTIPEGENHLWHTDRKGGMPLFGWRTRYWSFLLNCLSGFPDSGTAWGIRGTFPLDNRRLTFEEMCRIQTFPDGLKMESGRTEMQRMLGNAVPPLSPYRFSPGVYTYLFEIEYRFSPGVYTYLFEIEFHW